MSESLSYDDFKARLDIQDVLKDAGYHFNRRDGLRYPSYVRLDNEGRRVKGDKFIVTANGKGCFQPPQQRVYNVISFIAEHPDFFQDYKPGMNPHHLVNIVCNRLLNQPITDNMRNIIEPRRSTPPFNIKDYQVLQFQKHNYDNVKKFYPFFKSRHIDVPTQKAFASHFMLATKQAEGEKPRYFQNLSFPLRIPGQQDIVGFEERGKPRLDGSSGYKGKALGSNSSEGLWIASPAHTALKDAKDVLWFESAYDAMAYYQLHAKTDKELDKAVFLSTGGNPTVMQFRGVIREAQNAEHHLCFDNDLAGKQFAMNFQAELKHVRESLPKVGEDMKDYMATLHNPDDIFSGDEYELPKDLYDAYGDYESAAEQLHEVTNRFGPPHEPEEIAAAEAAYKVAQNKYQQMMREKLCIGHEMGPLKKLGTFDIPEWALCAIENGDREGLSEEEERELDHFLDKFPDGFVSSIDWDDYNEMNLHPAFGERNPNALTRHGESPYLAVRTYSVELLHPSLREAEAFPNLTVKREVPEDGCKDWNEQLIREDNRRAEQESQTESNDIERASGIDLDGDGQVETEESEEKKHHSLGR